MRLFTWILAGTALLAPSLAAGSLPGERRTPSEIRLELITSLRPAFTDTLPVPSEQEPSPAKKTSVGLAAVYSLLLPGMGEVYADNFSSGKYFLAAEGVLWLTYAVFQLNGDALRDDSRLFSVAHAGVMTAGKDDQFFVNVGNFTSVADYNDKKLRDREPEKVYNPALGYAWQWDSDASRLAYRDQRIRSETMYNDRKFIAAAIIVNHVASAINAARAAVAKNAALSGALQNLRFGAGTMGGRGVVFTVTRTF
jgi:hypothetical protein